MKRFNSKLSQSNASDAHLHIGAAEKLGGERSCIATAVGTRNPVVGSSGASRKWCVRAVRSRELGCPFSQGKARFEPWRRARIMLARFSAPPRLVGPPLLWLISGACPSDPVSWFLAPANEHLVEMLIGFTTQKCRNAGALPRVN
jgi:hypothetical protein